MAAVAGHTGKPSWQLPAFKNRPPLAVWASDDRLGTFVAGSPNAPPMAEDIYKLRLLDQEDEQSVKDQQQSGGQVSQFATSIVRSFLAITWLPAASALSYMIVCVVAVSHTLSSCC